jgi:hypothetical protein
MKKDRVKRLREILNRRMGRERFFGFPTAYGKKKRYESAVMVDYILHQQSNNPDKYIILELMRLPWRKKPELRIGYYILGKKRSVLGKWRWGQSAVLVPQKDIPALFKKAQILIKRYNKSKRL